MTSSGRMGWIGLDAPVEIMLAAGYLPVRLDPDPAAPIGPSAAYAEGGGHPWIRAAVDRILREGPDLAGIIIGSTPVLGTWLYNFLLTLARQAEPPPLPPMRLCNISHLERPSAEALTEASIRAMADALDVRVAALQEAIGARNAVRGVQRRIDQLRRAPAHILGSHARRLLDRADEIEPHEYVAFVDRELAEVKSANSDLTPIILSSPGSPDLGLYRAFERHGLVVVGDDMDFGSRAIGPDVPAGDPIAALARRYARRSPAPAGWSSADRAVWLTELALERNAAGVVFDVPDWAHPAAWDYPAERRALEAAGVRTTLLPAGRPDDQAAREVARRLGSDAAIHV